MGSAEVTARLAGLISDLKAGTVPPEPDAPPEIRACIDDLLSKVDTYRDGALIVLAYAVEAGTAVEIAKPPDGRRTVAQKLADLLASENIRRREDAFQTLAKGSNTLLGRKRKSWNELLEWAAAQDSIAPVERALRYMASEIVGTARDLAAMPDLDVSKLNFRRVIGIIDALLAHSSGGAYEQFTFAALLHALAEEQGNRRVETKTLSAADAAAGTAADVQSLEGGKTMEAYEVTANPWASKISQAMAVLQQYDLPRVHIVAPGPPPDAEEIATGVAGASLPGNVIAEDVDLSVLDLRQECRSLVDRLSKPGRRAALNKLWEHLASRQPDDSLVGNYVSIVRDAGVSVE